MHSVTQLLQFIVPLFKTLQHQVSRHIIHTARFLKVKPEKLVSVFFPTPVFPSSAYSCGEIAAPPPSPNAAFCLCLHVKELRALLCITEIEGREKPRGERETGVIHPSDASLSLSLSANPSTLPMCVCAHFTTYRP